MRFFGSQSRPRFLSTVTGSMGPTRLSIAKMMLATTSCLFALGADSPGFADNHPGFADNSVHRDRFVESWKRQALSGQAYSYPAFPWHLSDRPDNQRLGWMQPQRVYEQRGAESWQADFVVRELRSKSEAVIEVVVSRTNSSGPGTSTPSRTSRIYLFREFDFATVQPGASLGYTGGVIEKPATSVVLGNRQATELPVIEPAVFPPLPKHTAELGVGVRTWVDDTGNHSIEAALMEVHENTVRLITRDGEHLEVPIERLSVKDRMAVQKPDRALPRKKPVREKRRTVARRSRSPRRSVSFEDGLRAQMMNRIVPTLFDARAMNQSFYQAGLKMQRINAQVKMQMQAARGR